MGQEGLQPSSCPHPPQTLLEALGESEGPSRLGCSALHRGSYPSCEVGQGWLGQSWLPGKEMRRVLGLLKVEMGIASSHRGKTSYPPPPAILPPRSLLSSLFLSCFPE